MAFQIPRLGLAGGDQTGGTFAQGGQWQQDETGRWQFVGPGGSVGTPAYEGGGQVTLPNGQQGIIQAPLGPDQPTFFTFVENGKSMVVPIDEGGKYLAAPQEYSQRGGDSFGSVIARFGALMAGGQLMSQGGGLGLDTMADLTTIGEASGGLTAGTAAQAFPVVDTAAGITSNALGLAEGATAASGAATATSLAPVVEASIVPVTQAGGGLSLQQAINTITSGATRLFGGGGATGTTGGGGLLSTAATLLTGAGLVAAGVRAGGGSQQATQTTTAAPMSPEEQELLRLTIDRIKADDALVARLEPVVRRQLEAMDRELERTTAQQPDVIRNFVQANIGNPQAIKDAMLRYGVSATQVGNAMGYTPQQVSEYTGVPLTAAERSFARQEEIETIQLENLRRGTAATPEQVRLIDEATGAARSAGLINIERFVTQTTARINEELAAALGLNPRDTPIQTALGLSPEAMRLGTGLLGEATRQAGILESNLAQANAEARLNYPLAAAQVANATASSAGNLNLAAGNFRQMLDQQAAENRFRLFSAPYSLPRTNTAAGDLALNLGRQRLGEGTTSITGSRSLNIGDYARLAGGVGSLIYGTSRLFGGR